MSSQYSFCDAERSFLTWIDFFERRKIHFISFLNAHIWRRVRSYYSKSALWFRIMTPDAGSVCSLQTCCFIQSFCNPYKTPVSLAATPWPLSLFQDLLLLRSLKIKCRVAARHQYDLPTASIGSTDDICCRPSLATAARQRSCRHVNAPPNSCVAD